mmetsp:Transcript_70274/g.131428  ORF Transcript_70274/g.131428 Transcript_70274/m.131428 type:complete len:266 (-) Transcript_70274:1007-1804(-)
MHGKLEVSTAVMHIPNHEHHVKAGQNRGLEVHLIQHGDGVVIAAKPWICSSEDTAAGVEHCCDASLRDGDGLLLHGLVDSNAIIHVHLVELIDANNATISKHHGPTFQAETVALSADRRSETCCTASLATCVHSYWCSLLRKLQELTLRGPWVSKQEHVDVSSHLRLISQLLAGATKQKASNSLLDIINDVQAASPNRWSNGLVDLLSDIRLLRELIKPLLFLGGELESAQASCTLRHLHSQHLHIGVLDRVRALLPTTSHILTH